MKPLYVGGSALVVVALLALVLLWRSAPRPPAPPPSDQFQLSVVSDARSPSSWAVTLKIVAARNPDENVWSGVSVQISQPGGAASTTAPVGVDGRTCEATVGLNAAIIQAGGSTRLRTSFPITSPGGTAGGTAESDTTATSVTAVAQFTARPGLYRKGVPLLLGTLNGKPIQLTVGHP